MKVRILGSGTSSGVPRIGNDWGACDPSDPRNRRTRSSLLVEHDGVRVLIDTSPDMREQLLAAQVETVDAVIWTHDHADHCHGIDDLRQLFHARGAPIVGYARPTVRESLNARFGYIFSGKVGYPAVAECRPLAARLTIGSLVIDSADQPHGRTTSLGLRFTAGGHSVGYATDLSDMTPELRLLYDNLDVWIVDALRHAPHPSHPTVAAVLGWIGELQPTRSALVHMDHSMDYATEAARLPLGVEPGFDGQEFFL